MKTVQRYLSSINKGSHSRSFGLTGCWPWPLIGKVFFTDIGKRMATIMNLTPCRVCSEVYRGSFPRTGALSMSFHLSKGNWWNQSRTAVKINKFSCCNTSQFKHLQGPSDLNSRRFFFRCGRLQLWAPVQDLRRASNYNPGNLEKAKNFHWKQRRGVVLIPFKLYFLLPTRAARLWASLKHFSEGIEVWQLILENVDEISLVI